MFKLHANRGLAVTWGGALLLAAAQALAQGPQVNLTGLSLQLPGDATLYPFTAHAGSPMVWTLDAPPLLSVPQVDVHGKVTLVGTLSNTSGSAIPMAFLGPNLPPGAPLWLQDCGRFSSEPALPASF